MVSASCTARFDMAETLLRAPPTGPACRSWEHAGHPPPRPQPPESEATRRYGVSRLREGGPMQVWPGTPYPLGATFDGSGTNFALYSEVAERVELCLFDEHGV